MSKAIIISPSGNFYGSEQVLFDYLNHTKRNYIVYVPNGSAFYKQLTDKNLKHGIKEYHPCRLKLFYTKLFFNLLMASYDTIYFNEAGHSKYALLLGKLLPHRKFIIHIRIVEDTQKDRWPSVITSNVQVVSISKYMERLFFHKSLQFYDPYNFAFDETSKTLAKQKLIEDKFYIGIIGRISINKGLDILLRLLEYLQDMNVNKYIFQIFGTPDIESQTNGSYERLKSFQNVILNGFVVDKESIYASIDCVLHLAPNEPLGRIFPEAIDHNVPLIGFKTGGIGEIGNLTGLTELLIDINSSDLIGDLFESIALAKSNWIYFVNKCIAAKFVSSEIFSVENYTKNIDALLI